MKRYIYEGPVKVFDKCTNTHWYGETIAASEKKARSNLVYQYKKSHNRATSSRVTLPGEIVEVEL